MQQTCDMHAMFFIFNSSHSGKSGFKSCWAVNHRNASTTLSSSQEHRHVKQRARTEQRHTNLERNMRAQCSASCNKECMNAIKVISCSKTRIFQINLRKTNSLKFSHQRPAVILSPFLELRHLRTLCALQETGSLARAAHLHEIRALEQSFLE